MKRLAGIREVMDKVQPGDESGDQSREDPPDECGKHDDKEENGRRVRDFERSPGQEFKGRRHA
jgi:hypothetical protein